MSISTTALRNSVLNRPMAWLFSALLMLLLQLRTAIGVIIVEDDLRNVSTRLEVRTGGDVAIAGFMVESTQQILVRALGPTLQSFGVTAVLADPIIELHDGNGTLIASNDNWKTTQQSAISATGKAPPNDAESAILRTLNQGNYTMVVRGKNNTTGIALVEAYALDFQTNAFTLANVSTRGFAGTVDHVMIAGCIPGDAVNNVIVRALGPTLAQFGVPNVLMDPTLEVHDQNGSLLASNDNWQDTQKTLIEQSGFAPPNLTESAIIVFVVGHPSFTAIVRGKNNTIGARLVEVYALH